MNKHLYALTAIHRIHYQSLKRRFACLNTTPPGSTAKLIINILADPQIALYVQHFTIDGCWERWGLEWGPTTFPSNLEHVEYPASDMVQLEHAVQDSEYIPIDERDRWIRSLKDGGEDVLIALALTLLPNLTSIEFQPLHHSNTFTIGTVERIAEAKRSGGPLAKLISVTFGPDTDPDFTDSTPFTEPKSVELFAKLPSVKIINVKEIDGDIDNPEDIVPLIQSNVTDLNILEGDVSPQRLMLLLQGFESLQSFTYWPTSEYDRRYHFDAFWIVANLLVCAQDSLRELQLRAGTTRSAPSAEYMGKLRKFRVLETLDIDTKLLFEGSESLVQNFQTSLPASIREVKLHGEHHNRQALGLHIDSLTKAKNHLPNLSSIELFKTGISGNEAARLQNMCDKVNISLSFADEGEDLSIGTPARHRNHYAERQAKKALTRSEVL